jgi:hypothetical protein
MVESPMMAGAAVLLSLLPVGQLDELSGRYTDGQQTMSVRLNRVREDSYTVAVLVGPDCRLSGVLTRLDLLRWEMNVWYGGVANRIVLTWHMGRRRFEYRHGSETMVLRLRALVPPITTFLCTS